MHHFLPYLSSFTSDNSVIQTPTGLPLPTLLPQPQPIPLLVSTKRISNKLFIFHSTNTFSFYPLILCLTNVRKFLFRQPTILHNITIVVILSIRACIINIHHQIFISTPFHTADTLSWLSLCACVVIVRIRRIYRCFPERSHP